jgi:hypothetical protein
VYQALLHGREIEKPGWVRLNFSYLHSDAQAQRIIDAVADLAHNAGRWIPRYEVDEASARFSARPVSAAVAS